MIKNTYYTTIAILLSAIPCYGAQLSSGNKQGGLLQGLHHSNAVVVYGNYAQQPNYEEQWREAITCCDLAALSELLLGRGLQESAELLETNFDKGRTAFHIAVLSGNFTLLKFLLAYAKEEGKQDVINQQDKDGRTAMDLALELGAMPMVHLLHKDKAAHSRAQALFASLKATIGIKGLMSCKDFFKPEDIEVLLELYSEEKGEQKVEAHKQKDGQGQPWGEDKGGHPWCVVL